jgi:hypothetical protein
MSDRPSLSNNISVEDFIDFYWLKEELVEFCRNEGIPSSGAKRKISKRIEHYLQTGEKLASKPQKSKKSPMPENFTRETIIGSGWHCSQGLRAFFEKEIGKSFHFNQVMRDFIKNEKGKTLQAAIDAWHEAKRNPKKKKEIEPQFEYMRHMREYFNENPNGTREEALRLWHQKKAQRKSTQT